MQQSNRANSNATRLHLCPQLAPCPFLVPRVSTARVTRFAFYTNTSKPRNGAARYYGLPASSRFAHRRMRFVVAFAVRFIRDVSAAAAAAAAAAAVKSNATIPISLSHGRALCTLLGRQEGTWD